MGRGYVYVLTNDRLNVLYIGSTDDLCKRLSQHRSRLIPGFTKKYNVHRLIYYEVWPGLMAARDREHQLKGWSRAKKDRLIDGVNPGRRELTADVGV